MDFKINIYVWYVQIHRHKLTRDINDFHIKYLERSCITSLTKCGKKYISMISTHCLQNVTLPNGTKYCGRNMCHLIFHD